MNLQGRKILIGLTGSIACYKILELIRMFKRAGADVKVIATESALEFVTAKTLETLSLNPIYVNQFDEKKQTVHISLLSWADILIIAPLSANTLSKIAKGIADNLLTSIACAALGSKTPVIAAPAMNCDMWENEFVQDNADKLRKTLTLLEPETGYLACNKEGIGKMCAIQKIFDKTYEILMSNLPLCDKKIIVTAGGTREYIDPVRVITNLSSGKTGVALADCAYKMGACVELITTIDVSRDYKVTKVNTAQEMKNAIVASISGVDTLFMAAAVADYKVKDYNKEKISSENEEMTLHLVKNPDILQEICKNKRENQTIVGFCLSTENVIEQGLAKIKKKNCDFIIANEAKIALGTDETQVFVIDKNENIKKIELDTKENVAKQILGVIYDKN